MVSEEGTSQSLDDHKHVEISFVSNEEVLKSLPDSIFNVPTTADPENLNSLLNKTAAAVLGDWTDRRFEFLIGETFIRTSLDEFLEEYDIQTETVLKVECVLGLEAPKPSLDIPAPDWVSSVHVLDNFVLSTTYSGEAIFWNKKAAQVLSVNRDKGSAYKCSAIIQKPKNPKSVDGTIFVVGGENQTLTQFKVVNEEAVCTAVFRGHERSVEAVAVNGDGSRLISGAFDSHVKVWNLKEDDTATVFDKGTTANQEKTKKRKENFVTKVPIITLGGHKDAVVAVKWTPWSDRQIVSASWDHSLVVWDLELGGEVNRVRGQKAFSDIDVHSKTNNVITASTDSTPRLYDVRSNEGLLVKQSFIGHKGWVSSVQWSPNDDNCFVSASFDKVIKMWDIRSAKTSLFDLHGHEDRILCSSWDKKSIASGSVDCTVKLFTTN